MAKDPAFLFYPGDAAEDVSHMNRLERGAYFDIVQAQKKFGPLQISLIKKILGKDFDSVWEAVKICLTYEKDMYFIAWLQDSIEKRKKYSASRANNRKGQNQSNFQENEKSYVNHMENGNVNRTEIEVKDIKGVQGENQEDLWPQFEQWTEDAISGRDFYFTQMLSKLHFTVNGQLPALARDHLGLLGKYPRMQPKTQQRFRTSLISHIEKNYKPHDGSNQDKKQRTDTSVRESVEQHYRNKLAERKLQGTANTQGG